MVAIRRTARSVGTVDLTVASGRAAAVIHFNIHPRGSFAVKILDYKARPRKPTDYLLHFHRFRVSDVYCYPLLNLIVFSHTYI